MPTEPVRLSGYTALAVGLFLQGLILWASDVDIRPLVGVLAATATSSIGGLEFARRKVTPSAAPRDIDGTRLVPEHADSEVA